MTGAASPRTTCRWRSPATPPASSATPTTCSASPPSASAARPWRRSAASPGLHLVLRHNGKLVYEVPATAGLLDRITLFFGREVADHLYQIETGHGPARL